MPDMIRGPLCNGFGIMNVVYRIVTYIFDPLHHFWESDKTQAHVAKILIVVFLGGIAGIGLNQLGMLPASWSPLVPTSYYEAITLAFTLVLILEVISLIFTLPCSISRALGKQFEILALILLRSSFKELEKFPHPITISDATTGPLYNLLADAAGALVIFALLGIFLIITKKSVEDGAQKGEVLFRFVAAKKLLALILLGIFIGMGMYNGYAVLFDLERIPFFQEFYTILIFSDILLVLIAQRFKPAFRAVFRNSGYVVATLLIRLALTAPVYYDAAIGTVAALYAVLLTLAYNAFYAKRKKS